MGKIEETVMLFGLLQIQDYQTVKEIDNEVRIPKLHVLEVGQFRKIAELKRLNEWGG